MDVRKKALLAAFPYTIPIFVGLGFLSIAYGIYMKVLLKGVDATSGSHGLPELISVLLMILLHMWKRNMLLSIAGGVAAYMLLVQFVF